MPPPNQQEKCRVCAGSVARDVVTCTGCQAIFHPSCARQAGPTSGGTYQRCCGRRGSVTIDDISELLSKELNKLSVDVKTQFTALTDSVTELKNKVDKNTKTFNEKITKIENENTDIKKRLGEMESRIDKFEEKNTNVNSENLSSNIFREIEDRQSRRNNAIFFGVEEAASSSAAERRKIDHDTVQNICKSIAENISITGSTRIGKYSTVSLQPRPLKVFFSSNLHVDQIISGLLRLKRLKNPPQSIRSLTIVKDRTKMQQMERKAIHQELKDRISAGEQGLRIIQRAGTPIIITTHRPTSASTPKNSQ